jgi:hypothetical protein
LRLEEETERVHHEGHEGRKRHKGAKAQRHKAEKKRILDADFADYTDCSKGIWV